jgi:hypothetical protein
MFLEIGAIFLSAGQSAKSAHCGQVMQHINGRSDLPPHYLKRESGNSVSPPKWSERPKLSYHEFGDSQGRRSMTVAAPIVTDTIWGTVRVGGVNRGDQVNVITFGKWRGEAKTNEVAAPICTRHWMDAPDSDGWRQAGATGTMLSHSFAS